MLAAPRIVQQLTGVSAPTTERVQLGEQMRLGIRWTIGDVSEAGFEALRLSVYGAMRLFGADAEYLVNVNTVSIPHAKGRVGPVPEQVQWRTAPTTAPDVLRTCLGRGMAEGAGWKFMPLQAFPGQHELALDNDVILWELPRAIRQWLYDGDSSARVLAADVRPAHGQFAELCGSAPRNSGIRGTAPGFDFEGALRNVLARKPARLASELDEQGLQVAALSLGAMPLVVAVEEVSICSPFPPHIAGLGCCGAHFVGLNVRDIAWAYHDRPATEVRLAHWNSHRDELYRRVGLSAKSGISRAAAGPAASADP
jgi:hypothetical protein